MGNQFTSNKGIIGSRLSDPIALVLFFKICRSPCSTIPDEGPSGVKEAPLWMFLANLAIRYLVPRKVKSVDVQAHEP